MNFSDISPVIVRFLSGKDVDSSCSIMLAGSAGSRRMYYRLTQDLASFILMISPTNDCDFGRFLRLTQFYRLLEFPVPRVYCIDDELEQVLLEDLGDIRLYDQVSHDSAELVTMYQQAIDLLLFLQTRCYQRYLECPDISSRIFGNEELLWETQYFKREYVEGHLSINLSKRDSSYLESEFSDMAKTVESQPMTIMHRDFQSQNIMVHNNRLRIIDYQGSRLGSMYYDLASLLLDPYQMLGDKAIKELFQYYHSKSLAQLEMEEAYKHFFLAGTQRIMQALGAFSFLSRIKELDYFSQFIRPAEIRLDWILEKAGLTKLREIIQKLRSDSL
jgi:aminoglycoside/choline kinase family phosphotransferase